MATTKALLEFVDSITELSLDELDAVISKTRVRLLTLEAMRHVRAGTEASEPKPEPKKHTPKPKDDVPKVKRKYTRRMVSNVGLPAEGLNGDPGPACDPGQALGYQGQQGGCGGPVGCVTEEPEQLTASGVDAAVLGYEPGAGMAEPGAVKPQPKGTMEDRVVDFRRRRILEVLATEGVAVRSTDLCRKLSIPNGSITTTLKHEWFVNNHDGVRLTGAGFLAAEQAGYKSKVSV